LRFRETIGVLRASSGSATIKDGKGDEEKREGTQKGEEKEREKKRIKSKV